MGVLYNRLCFPLFCLWRYRSSSRHCYPCRLCSSVTLNFLQVPPSVPPCRSDVSLFEKLKKTSSSGGFSDCVYLHSRVCVCVRRFEEPAVYQSRRRQTKRQMETSSAASRVVRHLSVKHTQLEGFPDERTQLMKPKTVYINI